MISAPTSPDPTCILNIEAASPGGVPALVEFIYSLMLEWGNAPTIYRTQFTSSNLTLPQRILQTLIHWRPEEIQDRGFHTVIVPAPPFPLWLFYAVPHFLFGSLLGNYDTAFVASGSAHVALPLAARGIPYTLWVATLYEDELRAKSSAGDQWAENVLQSPLWPLLKLQERFVLQSAAKILALSPYTTRRIREEFPETEERLETVIYPVDIRRFQPNTATRENSSYVHVLLAAARLNDPRKNIPLLLNAFAIIHREMPDCHLILVGDVPGHELMSLVDMLGLNYAVDFPGIVDNDELLRLYQSADLFVLPSKQEGLGIVLLEAIACGTPVITTAYGGPEGIVLNGITGYHLDSQTDAAELAQVIINLLSDNLKLEEMHKKCVEFAHQHFALEHVALQIRDGFEAAKNRQASFRLRNILAVIWSFIIIAAYIQHQVVLHWNAIQSSILDPLLNILQ